MVTAALYAATFVAEHLPVRKIDGDPVVCDVATSQGGRALDAGLAAADSLIGAAPGTGRTAEGHVRRRVGPEQVGAGLGFVVPCLRALTGLLTHEECRFASSVTRWVGGARAGGEMVATTADESLALVHALHSRGAPSTVVVWDHRLPWAVDLGRLAQVVQHEFTSRLLSLWRLARTGSRCAWRLGFRAD